MRFIHIVMAVLLGTGMAWYFRQPGNAPAPALPPFPRPPAQPAPFPARQHAAATAAPRAIPAPASVPAMGTLEDDVAWTGKSDNPLFALAAFQKIQSCIDFQHGETRKFDDRKRELRELTDVERRRQADYCRSMTETMKRDRMAYLDKAVKGGAWGAAVAYANAGPFGDPSALDTRPGDPLVREWKKQAATYLAEGVSHGDLTAMVYVSTHGKLLDETGQSPLLQPAADIAIVRILYNARGDGSSASAQTEEQLPRMGKLTKVQLAAARAMADDFVAAHHAALDRKD